jgi:hypothetical protein
MPLVPCRLALLLLLAGCAATPPLGTAWSGAGQDVVDIDFEAPEPAQAEALRQRGVTLPHVSPGTASPRTHRDFIDSCVTAVGYGVTAGGYLLYCEGLPLPVLVPETQVDLGLTRGPLRGEARPMTKDMQGLLLDDRWAPVTSEMGFLEARAENAARAFAAWHAGLQAPRGISVQVRPVSGSVEQVLAALLPLSSPEVQRQLFMPTRSAWTAYVENGWTGTDASSAMSVMARTLGCRGLRVVAVPHTYRKGSGRYGAVMLDVFGPTAGRKYLRALGASNDGGRWVFDESGEPFPFERLERYQERRVRDRFTFEMLKEYLRHLGLSPFEEDFYLPEGAPAWLVERTGPVLPIQKEYTLEQARERLL